MQKVRLCLNIFQGCNLITGTGLLGVMVLALMSQPVMAQPLPSGLAGVGAPPAPKVVIGWDLYHDSQQLRDFALAFAAAYPELVRYEEIGKSYGGQPIVALTVTDFATGAPESKAGFYMDGNIHSNELQASEMCLYAVYLLTGHYGTNPFITSLLREKVFYIVPTTNPDGRDNFIYQANTMHSPRSGIQPFDDDRDGLTDEDGFDDLNNDGHITQMRRLSPTGTHVPDPLNPNKMLEAPAGQFGTYELIGYEGIDNDNDGLVNEDRTGYYDPNRNWSWGWQPTPIQWGAEAYPFSLPETKAVGLYLVQRPNIAGGISYHNAGGMMLRGPGFTEDKPNYAGDDANTLETLTALIGSTFLPGYHNWVCVDSLYSVYGGQTDWMFGALGIWALTGELWSARAMFRRLSGNSWFGQGDDLHEFNHHLLFDDAFVPWTPYKHPVYGPVEIGGFKKTYTRLNPGFLLQEDLHRNAAFAFYHAHHTPHLKLGPVQQTPLDGGLAQLDITVINDRLLPTRSKHDLKNSISPPDRFILQGADVVTGLVVVDDLQGRVEPASRQDAPAEIQQPSIQGMGSVTLRYIIKNKKGPFKLQVLSAKGGTYLFDIQAKP